MIRHGRRFGVVCVTLVALPLLLSSAASAAPFAYVKGGGKVSVIDVATNTVTATITIPPLQSDYGAAVTPSGAKLVVTSYYIASILVIDTATNTVSATIPGFTNPISVAFSPDETRAYVVDYGVPALRVVNLLTNTIVATIPVGTHPWGVAVNPAGTRAYVANEQDGTVSVINLSTSTVIATVATGGFFPIGVAVSPDGSRFYVTNNLSGQLTVFNAATNAVITNIANGGTFGVAVNASGSRAYATFGNSVQVINTSTNTIITTIAVGTAPYGLALTPDGTRLYVQNDTSNSVSVINTATNAVVTTITPADGVGQYGLGMFIGPMCPGSCSDGNVCTGDTCNMVAGCSSAPTAGSCDDGIFCNGVDACSGGSCVHPGDPCTGSGECSDTCNEAADNCFEPVGTPCASDSNVCTNDQCDTLGACVHVANTAPCNDGLFCNGTDTCSGGSCGHAGNPCTGGPDCANTCDEGADSCNDAPGASCTDDGNVCTDDECNGAGACMHPNNSAPCSDGSFCNGTDTCGGGSCSAHTGDPCAGADGDGDCSESCNESTDNCTANDPNGSACTDGAFCNGIDTCTSGSCSVHTGDPCPGPDGDADCSEACNEAADNCTSNDANGSACADTVFCNGADTCSGGSCSVHTGDPCAGADGDGDCSESCNELGDDCAANDPNGSACTDSTFCNGADTCTGGTCTAHAGDPCVGADGDGDCSESCNEASDDCSTPDPDGSTCTDGAFCDGTDTCSGGACSLHTGDPCPGSDGDADCSEACNETADNCTSNDPNGSACADTVFCNGTDTCSGGSCSVHTGNPCPGPDGDTDCSESCNELADDCTTNDANGSACADSTFCNGTDSCNGGFCSTHSGDPCAGPDGDANCSESCNESANDCTAADPNGSACVDSTFCNGTDTCSGGACASHSGDPCAGGSECADTCSESGGTCITPGATPCSDDGQPCTVDECDGAGVCLHPAGNAGAQCRADAGQCDVAETCDGASTTCPPDAFEPEGTTCDDGAACTIADECAAGTCGGSSITCGDGILQSACNEGCDDGGLLNDDGCNDTCELEPCKPLPDDTCKPPFVGAKASIKLRNDADDTRDSMQWKWIKGTQTDKDEFGDPVDTDAYWLCVYDDDQLVSTTEVTAGGTCDGSPCWSESGSGFKFKSKTPTTDGATGIKLGAGGDGKAKAQLKAKGAGVDVPELPPLGALTVQLVNATSRVCWTATYSPPFAKADDVSLSDRSD